MGQKLLAYLFYGFLVLMVIAAIILLKYQLDHKEIKQQQIESRANVVSRVDQSEQHKPEYQPEASKSDGDSQSSRQQTVEKSHTNPSDNQLSYLELYHQLKTAETCQPIFSHWLTQGLKADLSEIVTGPFRYYGNPFYSYNDKPPLTTGQQNLLQHWQQTCLNLWHTYGGTRSKSDDDPLTLPDISLAIEQRLNKTAAKTPREIKLKEVLKASNLWQQRYHDLEQALQGEDSLSEQELVDINHQIDQLKQQQQQLYLSINDDSTNNDDINHDAIIEELNLIDKTITELYDLLQQQKVINQEHVLQQQEHFNNADEHLFRFFYTNFGEVFYEALTTIVGHNRVRYLGSGYSLGGKAADLRITPVNMVLEANNRSRQPWYTESLNSATVLYLCDLGFDCSANSPLMFHFCLTDYPNYPDNCGLHVRDFYQRYFISPNQWSDVMTFKHSFEELFSG